MFRVNNVWEAFLTMAANKPKEVQPGYTGECNPEIFNLSARPEIKEKKPGQLPDATIRKFFEDVNIANSLLLFWDCLILYIYNHALQWLGLRYGGKLFH